MPEPGRDRLAETRYVTVILRLLVDGSGRLQYGEIVDTEGVVRERFDSWRGLTQRLQALIAAVNGRGGS